MPDGKEGIVDMPGDFLYMIGDLEPFAKILGGNIDYSRIV